MPLYICRWQNGDFSAAFARNRDEADIMFDEVGNPDEAEVFTARDFMAHFKLKANTNGPDDMTPFEFESFGERFTDQILEKAYPHFLEIVMRDDPDEKHLEAGLQYEKARLWGKKKAALSDDPDIRAMQMENGTFPIAMLKEAKAAAQSDELKLAEKFLQGFDPDGKPQ